MVFAYSHAFGPTTSTTGSAESQIGSDHIVRPGGPYHIKRIRIGKSGILIEQYTGIVYFKHTGELGAGTHEYAYGRGLGVATNAAAIGPAEVINCCFPISSGSTLQAFVKDVVDCPGVTISVEFHKGVAANVQSYAVQGSVTVAVTEESMGTVKITTGGRIIEARFVGNNNVDAEAGSAIFKISVPGRVADAFAVGNGVGGDTTGYVAPADVIGDLDIPVTENVTVDLRVCSTHTLMTPAASIAVA